MKGNMAQVLVSIKEKKVSPPRPHTLSSHVLFLLTRLRMTWATIASKVSPYSRRTAVSSVSRLTVLIELTASAAKLALLANCCSVDASSF